MRKIQLLGITILGIMLFALYQNFDSKMAFKGQSEVQAYGSCAVTGGIGRHLTPVQITTAAECAAHCSSLSQFSNRKCIFKGQVFRATNEDLCVVRGGGAALLFGPAPSSLSACQSECARFSRDIYRRCLFGDHVLLGSKANTLCEIKGGIGRWLAPPFYSSETDCRAKCDEMSENPNRSCKYGSTYLRARTTHALCVIQGEGGAYLQPSAFLSKTDCMTNCNSSAQARARDCAWGNERFL